MSISLLSFDWEQLVKDKTRREMPGLISNLYYFTPFNCRFPGGCSRVVSTPTLHTRGMTQSWIASDNAIFFVLYACVVSAVSGGVEPPGLVARSGVAFPRPRPAPNHQQPFTTNYLILK